MDEKWELLHHLKAANGHYSTYNERSTLSIRPLNSHRKRIIMIVKAATSKGLNECLWPNERLNGMWKIKCVQHSCILHCIVFYYLLRIEWIVTKKQYHYYVIAKSLATESWTTWASVFHSQGEEKLYLHKRTHILHTQ